MSEELFLLSPNKARWCKLGMITRALRWPSKISFFRTTELSVPKNRQVIAHAPPRLLLLKWKFPKLCMHTHVATGALPQPPLPPEAPLGSPHWWGCPGGAEHGCLCPGSVSEPAPSSPRIWGVLGTPSSLGWVQCSSPLLHPMNFLYDLGEDLLSLLKPNTGTNTSKLGLAHFGLTQLFTSEGCTSPTPLTAISSFLQWVN